jgi:tRNA U34 5-methylaminomethyl-2-thiouridine-forming methyltransferase MnmC
MKLPERSIVVTADGSQTLYVPKWDEHYHSIHGARQESEHVFINAGLFFVAERLSAIKILEIGFGTGLNAWLTALWTEKHPIQVDYTGIEAYPLTEAEIDCLQYCDETDTLGTQLFQAIHSAEWGRRATINPHFGLLKIQTDLVSWQTEDQYDLIYFDAFAPSAQPELWTEDVFSKLFRCTRSGGVLVTYCAKGDVRRAMKSAGWDVSKLPGPPRKREMTRATKP